MYRIIVAPRAKKPLKALTKLHKEAVKQALQEIKEDPFVGKPLSRELTGRFSYKIDVYRILYKVEEEDKLVEVFTAGHRAGVYE